MLVDLLTIELLWPEVILVAMATWIYMAGAFQQSRIWWTLFALAVYGMAAAVIAVNEAPLWSTGATGAVFSGPIVLDYLGFMLRCLALLVGVLFTLIASRGAGRRLSSELLGTLMLLVVGLMLVARANDLVFLFVSLELISLPTYVLLYVGGGGRATAEAAVKYFFLSLLSSAVFLYGLTFLYGLAGTTTLVAPPGQASIQSLALATADGSSGGPSAALVPLALVLVLAGLCFKIAAVPFHFYAPDVYQGTSNANAGLLAVAPKIAGIAAMLRLLVVAMPWASQFGWQLAIVLALVTMTVGNVCALWQANVRRLLAYSSIAHAGYMLIGVAGAFAFVEGSGAAGGISATLLYLQLYALAAVGIFAALTYLGSSERQVDGVDELAGLGRGQPLVAAALAVFLFSLAGVPPLAGFWGKFALFSGAISTAVGSGNGNVTWWFAVLATVGAVNAAVAAAYYLRVVSLMFFRPAAAPLPARGGAGALAAMSVCALLIIALGVFPKGAMTATDRAERAATAGHLTSGPARETGPQHRETGPQHGETVSPRVADRNREGLYNRAASKD